MSDPGLNRMLCDMCVILLDRPYTVATEAHIQAHCTGGDHCTMQGADCNAELRNDDHSANCCHCRAPLTSSFESLVGHAPRARKRKRKGARV